MPKIGRVKQETPLPPPRSPPATSPMPVRIGTILRPHPSINPKTAGK